MGRGKFDHANSVTVGQGQQTLVCAKLSLCQVMGEFLDKWTLSL